MWTGDTIVAVSSAPPPARRVVVRLSGPGALAAARTYIPDLPETRSATATRLRLSGSGGVMLDLPCVASVFRAPASYTAEDVVELGVPGSPWVVQAVLTGLLAVSGIRQAEPGEFTARAFLAGKLDLTAAEGVAAAIAAADERQLNAARQLRAGQLVREVTPLTDRLAELLALVEAGIDFSDEDVRFITRADLQAALGDLTRRLEALLARGRRFGVLSATPRIVLTGPPNAGKSTLLNRLTGHTRAVTSPVAGTTRDALEARLRLPRGEAILTDTAGLSDDPGAAGEPLAGQMTAAARSAVERADLVLHVIPLTVHYTPPARPADLTLRTLADLVPTSVNLPPGQLAVSAQTGQGIPDLLAALDELCFGRPGGDGLALTARHMAHLQDALAALGSVHAALTVRANVDELTAASLRDALTSLGHISGVVSPDDVLGRVFAAFCIGK